jgi:hypothetical protein
MEPNGFLCIYKIYPFVILGGTRSGYVISKLRDPVFKLNLFIPLKRENYLILFEQN